MHPPLEPAIFNLLAPPCIGAFIGYLTNKVAIRMLFRPLRPWMIGPYRLPMTPGVIPSKRHALAKNIGDMVGERLLTSKEIGAAISAEGFQLHLSNMAERWLEKLLHQEVRMLTSRVVKETFSSFVDLQESINTRLTQALMEALQQEEIAIRLDKALGAVFMEHFNGEIGAPDAGTEESAASASLLTLLSQALQSPASQAGLSDFFMQGVQQRAAEGKTLRQIMPEALRTTLHNLLQGQSGLILERFAAQIQDKPLQQALAQAAVGALHHFLGSLGAMGAMARGFFEGESIERKIATYLEDNQEQISAWLQGPALRERLDKALAESLNTLLDKKISTLLADTAPDQIQRLCQELAQYILTALSAPKNLQALIYALAAEIARTIASQATEATRMQPSALLLALLDSSQGKKAMGLMLETVVQAMMSKPLGAVLGPLSSAVRQGIKQQVAATANRILLDELPALVKSLNINEIVREKVDSLDLLQLEKLLLSIMEEQFKYINLFGALLGFLLGLLNLMLPRLG